MSDTADLPPRPKEKVEVGDSGCWLWTGSLTRGYGQLWWEGGPKKAHRVVYTLLVGSVPVGLELDHLCRVKACVNPRHLEPVTRSVNTKRGLSGVRRSHCKHGHPLVGHNIIRYRLANGSEGRRCRICHYAVCKKYRSSANG